MVSGGESPSFVRRRPAKSVHVVSKTFCRDECPPTYLHALQLANLEELIQARSLDTELLGCLVDGIEKSASGALGSHG